MPMKKETGVTQTLINVPEDTWTRFKLLCKKQGRGLSEAITELVTEKIRKDLVKNPRQLDLTP